MKACRQRWQRVISVAAALALGCMLLLSPSPIQAGTPDDSYTIERYYVEAEATDTTDNTPKTAASITFTPPATKYYLVLASCLTNNSSTAKYTQTELDIDGTDYSVAQHQPEDANNNWRSHATHKIIQLDATPHIIKLDFYSSASASTASIQKTRIAVIEVSNATDHIFYGVSETMTTNSTQTWSEKVTTGIFTPSSQADYLLLSTLNQKNKGSRLSGSQFTINDAMSPPEDYPIHLGGNYSSYAGLKKKTLNNAAYNLDIDWRAEESGNNSDINMARVAAVLLSDLGADEYVESTTETGNTGITYNTTKCKLTFTPTTRGDYLIIAMALGNLTDTSDIFDADLDLDAGTSLGTYIFTTGDTGTYNSFFIVKKVNLTKTSEHNITMQWRKEPNSGGSGTANIKSTKIIAIQLNTAESYTDSNYTTVKDNYGSGETIAYIWAHGLDISTNYDVVYYDAGINGGVKQGAGDNGIASSSYGNLSSSWDLTGDLDAEGDGDWHAVVYRAGSTPAPNYDNAAGTLGYVCDDRFYVSAAAIPEFPTVIAGIVVAGTCFGIYYWMRKKRLAYVKT